MSCDVGVVGLGTMGGNLVLNIAEKGFKVAGYARKPEVVAKFLASAGPLASNIDGHSDYKSFVEALKLPRRILLLVPAGPNTDDVIAELAKILSPQDIIVDCGNAHYKDQARRAASLEAQGLRFLGMGISGGEEGARKGPAFFPGGTLSVWNDIKAVVEAASAKASDGRPCVTMNGAGGAGSCVKMFHNAGEYAILQIWGETFNIFKAGGLSNDRIAEIFTEWRDRGFLASYMLDISIEACKARDTTAHGDAAAWLSDSVKDRIGSKGTGLWSAQEALEVGCPAPSLAAAVIARQMTMFKSERIANNAAAPSVQPAGSSTLTLSAEDIEGLYDATALSIVASYAQMFQCLRELDKVHKFGLNLPATIATFRAGCILKGHLLEPMTRAFEANPDLSNLMCAFEREFATGLPRFRAALGHVTRNSAVSTPVLSASLSYINAMFAPLLQYAQLVSLQRDVFGRHGFERLDKDGAYSHNWPELQ